MQEIEEILQLLNPWWRENAIDKELAKEQKRTLFGRIKELISYRQIVILSGLRRVGKTTLLYQLIEHLLKDVDSKKIIFFSFDKKITEITALLDSYQNLTNLDWKKEHLFVFLDELTKLDDWAGKLKIIYDSFPNIKFFVSSSSSLSLEEEALKYLAGRYFALNLKPLSFSEFLELKGNEDLLKDKALYQKEIKKKFGEYLLRSFPEITAWTDELLIKDYLRSTIIDKIVKIDLSDKFKKINKSLLLILLEMFYKEPGMYLDYDNLSNSLRISKRTLIKHIYYLEFSYLIRIIRNFRVSTLSSLRKLQRVYPYWWTLAYCYGDNKDKIMENLVISYSETKNYWRESGKEIDLILLKEQRIIPVEVKNKEEIRKEDWNNILYFLKKYKLGKGYFIYNGEKKIIFIDKKEISLIPFWDWLLEE